MQAFLKGSSCFWVLKQYLFCPSSHRLVSGLRCCVEIPATSTSVPSLAVRLLSAAGDGVLVPLCEGGFLCILLLFSAQQSLEGLERKEKQHTLTSLPLSLWVGCLSASLGYTLLIIFAGADYGHSCSSHEVQSLNFTAGLQNILFNHLCRWAENAPLCILPSFLSFPFFFSFPVLWRWQHCRYSRPIFSCLFAHCCAHMLLYVHSPALAPERVSGFRKKSWVVAVVVKDAQMQYFCIYSEISWEHLGVSCSTQLKLSCITQLCRFGLTLVSFVREKPLTQLFSWPHAYIIFPRYI